MNGALVQGGHQQLQQDERTQKELRRRLALRFMSIFASAVVLFGFFLLLASHGRGGVAVVGVGGLIFLAAASVGGTLGFLFAVPRVLAQDLAGASAGSPAGAGERGAEATADAVPTFKTRLLQSNTNLERISDWLTTMLVGVGLTQLPSIDNGLYRFRRFIEESVSILPAEGTPAVPGAAAVGPGPGILPAVGPMMLIFGAVIGFLSLYLYTRLVVVSLLHDVEADLAGGLGNPEATIDEPEARQAVVSAARSLDERSEIPTMQSIRTTEAPSFADSISIMFRLLYRPGGYQEVIDLGAKLAATQATQLPEYWFYLAAAFGQKYSALGTEGAPEEDRLSTRDNALESARRAVDLDPSYRTRLWQISDPTSIDNDLAPFRDDPTFRRIIGVPG